ncbi:MAG: PHP domain-containing protein [Methanomassiliicoccales archaeon]|nr:PHP domain-containing protein [Methanomassiliicoccales archaeon]
MKADLHLHSEYSRDCSLSVRDIVRRCGSLNVGAIAIVDHNSFMGSIEALALDIESPVVLAGMEITTDSGHVLAYHVTEAVEKGLSVEETIDRIHGLGGIAAAPHPRRTWSGLDSRDIIKGRFDAIEALNGRSLRSSNKNAERLAKSLGLSVIGGSDAHSLKGIGKALTVFPDHCQTAEDLAKAILRRQTTVEGSSRSVPGSIGYAMKCVSEWVERGFKRL